MKSEPRIEFIMRGKNSEGVAFTPNHVPLKELAEYTRDLQLFITGSDLKLKKDAISVEIKEGSIKIIPYLSFVLISILAEQIEISHTKIENIDPTRAKIIKKWQETAKSTDNLEYEISIFGEKSLSLKINNHTNFGATNDSMWFDYEDFLIGEIVEAGGVNNTNVHIRPSGSTKTITVDIPQELLRTTRDNIIYHKKILLVRGEKNIKTKETRNIVAYRIKDIPEYNSEYVNELINKAKKTWHDTDSQKWLKEMRGEA